MIDDRVRELADGQHGLLSRAQLHDLGVGRSTVRWALGHGWRCVLPSVVSVDRAPVDGVRRLVAALLHAGPDAMLSSLTAARWHGVTAATGCAAGRTAGLQVEVTVPAGRHPRSCGFVVVRRTYRPDPHPWDREPLRITCPARAVVEAARDARTVEQARAIVCEAVQRRLVTTDLLRHELEAGPRSGSARARAALDDAEAGAWSVPEAELRRLVSTSRILPPLRLNPCLRAPDGQRLPTPDGWFDDVAMAVQVHSWTWHASMPDWNATVMSDGVYAEYGIVTVAITPDALRRTPGLVLARLEATYRQASLRPRPQIRMLDELP